MKKIHILYFALAALGLIITVLRFTVLTELPNWGNLIMIVAGIGLFSFGASAGIITIQSKKDKK